LQFFVWAFVLRAEFILNKLTKKFFGNTQKYENEIKGESQTDKLRSPRYLFLKWLVNSIIVISPRFVVVIMSIITLQTISLSNLILAAFFLFNIILVDFVLARAHLEMRNKFTLRTFKITQIVVLIFLLFFIIDKQPLNVCPIFRFSSRFVDKALLFTILQLVVDLMNTEDFKQTLEKNVQKETVRVSIKI